MVYTLTFYNSQHAISSTSLLRLTDNFLHLDMQVNLQMMRIRLQSSELRSIVPSYGVLVLCTYLQASCRASSAGPYG
jgi:hypothetical protein